MQYREIGNTGIRISEIGFGTGGNAGLMVKGDPTDQLRAIERAIELGINYFDAAPDYGSGVSETNLGRALRELGVRPIITTKVEVREANLADIAGHVERSVEASLGRLGVDYVDFVQIHNGPVATRPKLEGRDYRVLWIEDFLGPNGALEGLERIRRAGQDALRRLLLSGRRWRPDSPADRHGPLQHHERRLPPAESNCRNAGASWDGRIPRASAKSSPMVPNAASALLSTLHWREGC